MEGERRFSMVNTQLKLEYPHEEGIRWSSILVNEVLDRGSRLDASYYDMEGRKARELVKNCKLDKLFLNSPTGLANVYYSPRFKRTFTEDGIPIYTASQILELIPTTDKSISEKTKTQLAPLYLKEGQIVMTRSGNIGLLSIVSRTLDHKLFSDDLLRLECYDKDNIGYVYAFLKTKMGQALIRTNDYGSVVTHLEPEHLNTLIVPIPPDKIKDKISIQIMSVFELRDEANELLDKANSLLFSRLNIPPIKDLKPKYYASGKLRNYGCKLSELDLRLDFSYHDPLIRELINQLEKSGHELTTLSDKKVSKEIILPGRFKRIYVTENYGVPFLGGGEILEFDPRDIKYLSVKNHAKRIYKELTLHENMVLITCSGTVGNVLLSPKHFENWTASQHIIRIVPSDNMNPGYVYAFLASDYGHRLIKRYVYGSVVDEIDDNQVACIPIPIPSPEIMNEIGNLVLEANKKRTEAYRLEKEAINEIETLIYLNAKFS